MNNHVIILLFLSCLPILNLDAGEVPLPAQNSLEIINTAIFCDHNWHELEVQLSNGDAITYTIGTKGPLHNAHACIYAEKVDAGHEKRYNANANWVSFMHNLYANMIASRRK